MIRPNGLLTLIWNVRDPFVPAEQGAERPWREPIDASPAFGEIERRTFPFEQLLDAEGLVGHVVSISWIARLEPVERERVLERIRELGSTRPAPFPLPYSTETFVAPRLG